jgi:hypothetical protein
MHSAMARFPLSSIGLLNCFVVQFVSYVGVRRWTIAEDANCHFWGNKRWLKIDTLVKTVTGVEKVLRTHKWIPPKSVEPGGGISFKDNAMPEKLAGLVDCKNKVLFTKPRR